MGGKKRRKREAERLGGAAALGAFLSQPVVKDLVVKAILAGAAVLADRWRAGGRDGSVRRPPRRPR